MSILVSNIIETRIFAMVFYVSCVRNAKVIFTRVSALLKSICSIINDLLFTSSRDKDLEVLTITDTVETGYF